ncbi:MAG TPA: hypothetical protein VGF55_17570 [Gemmataceae bacterium]|jgi:hypothetical protein
MAVSTRYFQATLTGQSTHTYPCAGCGCVFKTIVERTVSDTGDFETVARQKATRRLAAELKAAAEVRPCPGCGLVPPGVVARRAQYRHAAVWLGTGLAAAAVGGLAAIGRVPLATAALAVPAVALLGVLLHGLIAFLNPNRHRAANHERAQADVAAGATEVLLPGKEGEAGRTPRAWTARHTAGIALAAAAPLALLVPAALRAHLGRAINADLRPEVVAPGTTFTAPLPPPAFRSVNGWWSATATVDVLNAAEAHAPKTLAAFTRPAWGGGFHLSDTSMSVPSDLHVAATIPDDPALEGQTLRLRATLNVVYPTHMGNGAVDKSVTTVTHEFPVTLAGRSDYQAYTTALTGGLIACLVGTTLGGALLASGIGALKRQIAPPELVRLGDNGGAA